MSERGAQPLPGGYTVGDKVFFTGACQTVFTGDKVVHGQQGEVTGPGTLEYHKANCVRVLFPGNKKCILCFLAEVRRFRAASTATSLTCAPHTRRCPRPMRSSAVALTA